tara:strand:- start:17 stop:400 length:384 start_codon:yes stop_codon:yes gene_type:complete
MVKILEGITKDQLINFQNNSPIPHQVIIKFEAEWCKPCQQIKELCHNLANQLNNNVGYIVVDIDENIELYAYLKTKKQVKGVPTLLSYHAGPRNPGEWFLPNDSVVGADNNGIVNFFTRCSNYSLQK